MNTFILHLQSATEYERIEGVTSLVGQDASGVFGIMPKHERLLSLLTFGLVRFRVGEGSWQYLAVPGALFYFLDNQLFLNTRRYIRGDDYEAVRATLRKQFMTEEKELKDMKQSLRRLEEEMFKRLLEMHRGRSE
jgi:F-type H+-transporting ATPase subunit epsilon